MAHLKVIGTKDAGVPMAAQLATDVAEVSAAADVILKDEVVLTGATPGTLVGTIIDGAGVSHPYANILDFAKVAHCFGMVDGSNDYYVDGILEDGGGLPRQPYGILDNQGFFYATGTIDAIGYHTPLP